MTYATAEEIAQWKGGKRKQKNSRSTTDKERKPHAKTQRERLENALSVQYRILAHAEKMIKQYEAELALLPKP